jgi:hypothetical protein
MTETPPGPGRVPAACIRCNAPLVLLREPGLCSACRHAVWEPEFAGVKAESGGTWKPLANGGEKIVDFTFSQEVLTEQESQALRTELGMPPEAPWKRVIITGRGLGPRWVGYHVALVGIPTGWMPGPHPGCSLFRLEDVDGQTPTFELELWQLIAWRNGSPLYAERRWHPEIGERIAIKGLEQNHKKHDIDCAWRSLELLREVELRGKQAGTGRLMGTEEFRQRFRYEMDRIPAKSHPTKRKITEALGIDRSTLDDYLRDAKIDWDEAKLARARRLRLISPPEPENSG